MRAISGLPTKTVND